MFWLAKNVNKIQMWGSSEALLKFIKIKQSILQQIYLNLIVSATDKLNLNVLM